MLWFGMRRTLSQTRRMSTRLDCSRLATHIEDYVARELESMTRAQVKVILPVGFDGKGRLDSSLYVRKKQEVFTRLGITSHIVPIFPNQVERDLKNWLIDMNGDPHVHGVMVQLPLIGNEGYNVQEAIELITPEKDIDGLGRRSGARMQPATPLGICALLRFYDIPTRGRHIVVVGKGSLVGRPLASMLANPPYGATVTVCDIHTRQLSDVTRHADIIVTATGQAHFLSPEHIKPDVVVVDAGICRGGGNRVTGDVHPSTYLKCGAYTSVPGGVGLLTVSALASNVLNARRIQEGRPVLDLPTIVRGRGTTVPHSQQPSTGLRILLFSTSYNGLTQSVHRQLTREGHVVVYQPASSADSMEHSVSRFSPDLIICPTLMTPVPESIYSKIMTLIVHPGVVGDRGPSSIDWAILKSLDKWGVTVVQAHEEMDAGAVWDTAEFSLHPGQTKTQIYNENISSLATQLVSNCVRKFQDPLFRPRTVDYSDVRVKGRLHETLRQSHPNRSVDWDNDTTETILRKMRAADGHPGLKADICIQGKKLVRFLYDGRAGDSSSNVGRAYCPGEIFARQNEHVYIATKDGYLTVGQLRAPKGNPSYPSFKLPAMVHLAAYENEIPPVSAAHCPNICIQKQGPVGIIAFDFYNGAMSTNDCERLEEAIKQVSSDRDIRALVLRSMGPSNGIHLNVAEAATDPNAEAYANLVAINKVVKRIVRETHLLTVSEVLGNAGAGGVFLALAADFVFVKPGVILNPHYSKMGLYGSELHTYLGEKRVGQSKMDFLRVTAPALSVTDAVEFGLIDDLDKTGLDELQLPFDTSSSFSTRVDKFVSTFTNDKEKLELFLKRKEELRLSEERIKPIEAYEAEELREMREDIFKNRHGFREKRAQFVYKGHVPEEKRASCQVSAKAI